ncbi:MAG TPA: chorismate mutase [Syntrophaceticus sp.]|nr:chorismate mutase [Syntrophaceticus sp.]
MEEKLWVRGIRGAVTVQENSPEAILGAVRELLEAIASCNNLQPEKMISILFSVTQDLNAVFPAQAARELGWVNVPLICTLEIPVPGSLKRCIRVLIHAYLPCSQNEVKHVYLGDAAQLRPDLDEKNG